MTGQYTYSRNPRPFVGAAIGVFVLATLLCKLDGAATQVCNLLDKTAWVALEVLRTVILVADSQVLQAYLYEDSRFLQHLMQIGVSLWPLRRVMAA
jgi:hypothetical protein